MQLSDIKIGHRYKYWIGGDTFIEEVVRITDKEVIVRIIKARYNSSAAVGDLLRESINTYLGYFRSLEYTRVLNFNDYADRVTG